jgi:hypothetical protein
VVHYTFEVSNVGDVTLTGITVSDTMCDAPGPVYVSGDTNTDSKLQQAWVDWILEAAHETAHARRRHDLRPAPASGDTEAALRRRIAELEAQLASATRPELR